MVDIQVFGLQLRSFGQTESLNKINQPVNIVECLLWPGIIESCSKVLFLTAECDSYYSESPWLFFSRPDPSVMAKLT